MYRTTSLQLGQRPTNIFEDYRHVDYWQKPGDQSKYPISTVSGQSYLGQFGADVDSSIEKVYYIRLKQLTFGYNVPKDWMKKIYLEGARLFFTVENLFLLTNYSGIDPEVVSPYLGYDNFMNYPLARKLTLGLTLKF